MAESQKAQAQSNPPTVPWKQPSVSVGEVVNWHPGKSGKGSPAVGIVTQNKGQTLDITLHVLDDQTQKMVRGAQHVSDPALAKIEQQPGGVWDHTEFGKKVHALID